MTDQADPFTGPQLKDSVFTRASMERSDFDGVNLSSSRFYAVLDGSRFEECRMNSVAFDDINLSDSSFNNINFSRVKITDAKFDGMRIDGILVTDLLETYRRAQSAD